MSADSQLSLASQERNTPTKVFCVFDWQTRILNFRFIEVPVFAISFNIKWTPVASVIPNQKYAFFQYTCWSVPDVFICSINMVRLPP